MRFTYFRHTGVLPNGVIPGGGAVEVNGRIGYSAPSGGCGDDRCKCSPGHWLSVVHPRTPDGVVSGYTVHFDTRAELEAANIEDVDQQARKHQTNPSTKE